MTTKTYLLTEAQLDAAIKGAISKSLEIAAQAFEKTPLVAMTGPHGVYYKATKLVDPEGVHEGRGYAALLREIAEQL